MKIVIDSNELVTDAVALKMVLQILDREDGDIKFTGGLMVRVKTSKTQKLFSVLKQ